MLHTEADRIDAVYRRDLLATARAHLEVEPHDAFSAQAVATCEHIAAGLNAEVERLNDAAASAGVAVTFRPSAQAASQIQFIRATPGTPGAPAMAAAIEKVVAPLGYRPWAELSGRPTTFTSMADTTCMIEVEAEAPSVVARAVASLRRRLGGADPSIGPFLSTPMSLLGPLLEFAQVGSGDVVVDLGCGDGRFVVEAARLTGARAVGVENDPVLVGLAAERIAAAAVGDQVSVHQGDARSWDLDAATVVLLFLPPHVTAEMVAALLPRLRGHTRLIAHEQFPIAHVVEPAESKVVLSEDSITVAHRWASSG